MNSRTSIAVLLSVAAVFGTTAIFAEEAAPDLAKLLAHHREARGGGENWARVQTMTVSGIWEAFSTPGPFTTHRGAPDHWRFEHVLFDMPAILAFDGEATWLQGAALGVPEPARLEDPWKRNLLEDARLLTPLLAGPSDTLKIESLGTTKIDGVAAWSLKVVREGFPDETWYLDAETFLELKRESMTFDVFSGGIEIPMETFYDDFREVDGGIVLPFHEERHFGTRYHVTDVEKVVVNGEFDPASFAAPPPAPEEAEQDEAKSDEGS